MKARFVLWLTVAVTILSTCAFAADTAPAPLLTGTWATLAPLILWGASEIIGFLPIPANGVLSLLFRLVLGALRGGVEAAKSSNKLGDIASAAVKATMGGTDTAPAVIDDRRKPAPKVGLSENESIGG